MLTPDNLNDAAMRFLILGLDIVNKYPITVVPQVIEDIKNLMVNSVETYIES